MAYFLYIFGKTLIDYLNMAGLPLIWIIFIGFTLLSWLVSHQLQSRFKKYSKIPTANGMTGRDVVEKMLRDNGVQGVKIGSVEGQLTDHYNPTNKTINVAITFGSGSGGELCVALGAMDFVGGNYFGRHFPQFIVDRYSSFCDDNFV